MSYVAVLCLFVSEKWERIGFHTVARRKETADHDSYHKLRTQNSMNAIGHWLVPSIRIQAKDVTICVSVLLHFVAITLLYFNSP